MTPPSAAAAGSTAIEPTPGRWAGTIYADLRGFCLLGLFSLLVGVGINQVRHQPLPLVYRAKGERLRAAVAQLAAREPAALPPAAPSLRPKEIALEEFQALVTRNETVIDARLPFFYHQGHVPGAINLPRETFQADYTRLGSRLGARKPSEVAVYCSGVDCPDAQLVAEALVTLGFRRVLVYKEGWDEWSQSGLPQEK